MHDKAFNIAKNLKYDGYQCGLTSMVYKFFDNKTSGSGIKSSGVYFKPEYFKTLDLATRELAEELHKQIIRKF